VDIEPHKTYAVISGDIIGSSKLPPDARADLPNVMKHASSELRALLAQSVPLNVDIYAGDSWQLLVNEPGDALRAAVFYRASILAATDRKVDTRLVIALGTIDFVPGERVSEGDGEAFRLSGLTLAETGKRQRMRFAADSPDRDYWDVMIGLLDAIMRRWSTKQTQAVLGVLQGRSPAEIAAHANPPVERQTASKLLDSASWESMERTLDLFQKSYNTTNG